jgi:type I restriction enzyme M protein
MRWVAPTEKDTANQTLEKRLWAAADQFGANSGLKAGQYSTPVLGLIFLRYVEPRATLSASCGMARLVVRADRSEGFD